MKRRILHPEPLKEPVGLRPTQPVTGRPVPTRVPYALKVGSLNLWNPGENKRSRNEELARRLRERSFSLVLLQEMDGSEAQLRTLVELGGFKYGMRAGDDGDVGILSQFKLEGFIAPDLPREPSKTPINQTWKHTQKAFCHAHFQLNGVRHHVISNHWENRKLINRQFAAAAATHLLASIPPHEIVLFGGDFNTRFDSVEMKPVLAAGMLNTGPADDRIDIIFFRGSEGRVVGHYREEFPGLTDHPFIWAELSILGHGPSAL